MTLPSPAQRVDESCCDIPADYLEKMFTLCVRRVKECEAAGRPGWPKLCFLPWHSVQYALDAPFPTPEQVNEDVYA
jgi:hypothetical protein